MEYKLNIILCQMVHLELETPPKYLQKVFL